MTELTKSQKPYGIYTAALSITFISTMLDGFQVGMFTFLLLVVSAASLYITYKGIKKHISNIVVQIALVCGVFTGIMMHSYFFRSIIENGEIISLFSISILGLGSIIVHSMMFTFLLHFFYFNEKGE
jgi:uncharacterized membrane protein